MHAKKQKTKNICTHGVQEAICIWGVITRPTRKASENQTYILKVLEVFLSSVCVGQGVSQGVGQGVRTFVRRPVGDFTQSLVYGSFWLKRTTSLLL